MKSIYLWLSLLGFSVGCSGLSYANWHTESFAVMGTTAQVELWHQDTKRAQQLIQQVKDEMTRIEQSMSPYKPNSELSRINRLAYQQAIETNVELFQLLIKAQEVANISQGAFDISFASVGFMYDYRAKKRPLQQQIQQYLPSINYQSIQLDNTTKTVRFLNPNIKIDLGGIAKGYAVKHCIAILKQQGVTSALISAGGDTQLLGDKQGREWTVAIQHPRAKNKQAVLLPLKNEAISTSGDYERYFIQNGERVHHILNPKTGHSANGLVSVSVIGSDAVMTDALSTTLFVLGLKAGMHLIESMPDYQAVMITPELRMHFSSGLQNF
ncbi:FAD:protein FMN transferase [Catenovulum sediminis]|uniref:FAD:protein FMN transferase n=1 Tax=Catenovulum sediminis TaxID=1740262 RepID=A0ABV1RL94_9ALTE|nr:FAD:protein FMN transferase [Catenovulum sediminis]